VANEKEFLQKVRQLGTLVGELEHASNGANVSARELVQLLMEVHGAGLERIMELIFESGSEGEAMIARLGQDTITRSLLLLYSLHPDDLETRVLSALDKVRARLRKLDHRVELVSIHDGTVQLKVHASGKAHGTAAKNVRTMIEETIYDLAPDVASLTILGLDEGTAGFVPLESLLGHSANRHALVVAGVETESAK
jgi:hypothetical protein